MPAYHSIQYLLGLCSDTVFSRNSNSKCQFSFPGLCFSYLYSDIYYVFFPVSLTFVWLLCFHFLEVQHLIAYANSLWFLNIDTDCHKCSFQYSIIFFKFYVSVCICLKVFFKLFISIVIYSLFRNELFLPYLFGFLRFCCYSLLFLLCQSLKRY